jgi:hypothetical protein
MLGTITSHLVGLDEPALAWFDEVHAAGQFHCLAYRLRPACYAGSCDPGGASYSVPRDEAPASTES